MNRVRYLAAGFLCLTGVIHVAQLVAAQIDRRVIIMVIFGVPYSIIGGFLFRNNKTAYYLGAIVPLIGISLATVGMFINPTILLAFLMAIDVVIVLSCFYFIKGKRSV